MDDRELAQRVAAREKDAFVLLMQRHNRMLYRAARSILNDEAEVEDVVQDTYLQAFRSIGQFRGEAKLSTWLVRIVLNEALARTRLRSRGLALAIRLDREPDNEAALPELPEQAAQRSETRRLLEAKIDELPGSLRSVFVLRALEGLSVEEVSAALGVSRAVVRIRYFRARRLLRSLLSSEGGLSMSSLFPFAGRRCAGIVAAVLARQPLSS